MGTVCAGMFGYKPEYGASGEVEKGLYDIGADNIANRLAKSYWVGDPGFAEETGATDLHKAIAGLGSTNPAVLYVSGGPYALGADNLTVTANIHLIILAGTSPAINLNGAGNLIIQGSITAGRYKCFTIGSTGAVSITGNRYCMPEWWGAADDTESSAAFKSAFAAVADSTTPGMVHCAPGVTYLMGDSDSDGYCMYPSNVIVMAYGSVFQPTAKTYNVIRQGVKVFWSGGKLDLAQTYAGDYFEAAGIKSEGLNNGTSVSGFFKDMDIIGIGTGVVGSDIAGAIGIYLYSVGGLGGAGNQHNTSSWRYHNIRIHRMNYGIYLYQDDTAAAGESYNTGNIFSDMWLSDCIRHINIDGVDTPSNNAGNQFSGQIQTNSTTTDYNIYCNGDSNTFNMFQWDIADINQWGVYIHTGCTHNVTVLSDARASSKQYYDNNTGSYYNKVVAPHHQQSLTAGTIDIDVRNGCYLTLGITANCTINAPTGMVRGDRIQFDMSHNTGASYTVTWNSAFKVSWTDYVDMGALAYSSIEFEYNGTNWRQMSAQRPWNPEIETRTGTAGENLTAFQAVYFKSDSKYWKAKADAATTVPCIALAAEAINADASGIFIRRGRVTNSGWSWTVGGKVYVSDATGGALTQTMPADVGEQVQIVGVALAATVLDFDPSLYVIEI